MGEREGPRRDAELRDLLAWERTRLANERTLLAYVRTALALAAGGSALQFVRLPGTESGGWAAIALGFLVLAWGGLRGFRLRRRLLRLRPRGVDAPGAEGL